MIEVAWDEHLRTFGSVEFPHPFGGVSSSFLFTCGGDGRLPRSWRFGITPVSAYRPNDGRLRSSVSNRWWELPRSVDQLEWACDQLEWACWSLCCTPGVSLYGFALTTPSRLTSPRLVLNNNLRSYKIRVTWGWNRNNYGSSEPGPL